MSLRKEDTYISEADYLAGELCAEFKSEYIDGHIYAMVGASANHSYLAGNVFRFFGNHLENSPCNAFISDFKVKVGARYFYPDVLVRCDNEDEYYTEQPTIIIEVLSPSTRKHDRSFKLDTYKNIPSLIEYVMIEQDKCSIEVYQRTDAKLWNYTVYVFGDEIYFKSVGLTLSVEAIYKNVDNAETRPPMWK